MFRTVPMSIIRSLFTVHSAMVYVIQVCRPLSSRTRMELQFHPGPARNLSVQWINSWWGTEELSETCRVSYQNKFVKLVHLVGFVIKTLGQFDVFDATLTLSPTACRIAPAACRLFVDGSAFVTSNGLNKNSHGEERRLCRRYKIRKNQIPRLVSRLKFMCVFVVKKIPRT